MNELGRLAAMYRAYRGLTDLVTLALLLSETSRPSNRWRFPRLAQQGMLAYHEANDGQVAR